MTRKPILIYIAALLAVTFWGLSYIWMKVVFEYYQPITTMFLRLCISSLFLLLIIHLTHRKEKIAREDYKAFLALSFFSPFCYFLGESFGLKHVAPTVAAVIIATIPVFAPLLGYIAFREKVTPLNIMGFFISFIGVVIMVLDFEFRFTASPLGVVLLFMAVFSALANMIFLRKLANKYSSLTIISTQNIIGALFFLPLFLVFDFQEFRTVSPTLELIKAVLMLAIFASSLAFMFFTIAVRNIGIAKTSIFTNLIPVITALASYWWLKEALDLNKILGMAIVISGLLLTQLSRFRKKQ